jgi:hypothetical protein
VLGQAVTLWNTPKASLLDHVYFGIMPQLFC